MTALDREGLRRLADAATEGPWEYHSAGTGIRGGGSYFVVLPQGRGVLMERGWAGKPADAEFAAACRMAVPALLDAIDRVLALCDVQDSPSGGVNLLTTFEVRRALGVEADQNG